MDTKDILNIIFIFGVIIVTACALYITYYLVQTLKSLTQLTNDLDETAENIKSKLQMKILATIPAILVSLVGRILKKKRG